MHELRAHLAFDGYPAVIRADVLRYLGPGVAGASLVGWLWELAMARLRLWAELPGCQELADEEAKE